MPTAKLTKRFVEAQRPEKSTVWWDTELRGFGVRISPQLRRVYLVQYREGGQGTPTRRPAIGLHGVPWTVDQARARAREILADVAAGRLPVAGEPEPVSRTFSQCRDDFIEKYAKPRNRTWQEADRTLKRYFFTLDERDIRSITKSHIHDCIDDIMRRGKHSQANRALAHVKKLFAWLEQREAISQNPIEKLQKPAKEQSRDRVLSDEELVAICQAAQSIGYPFGDIVRILILTGQRRDEVGGMLRPEIDLRAGVWRIPGTRNKSNRGHTIPLCRCAARILLLTPRVNESDIVFTTNGDSAFSGYGKAKTRLDDLSGVSNWRLHDIRRSVASGMQRLGVLPAVIEVILNHVNPTGSELSGIYQRYSYEPEVRTGILRWSRHLAQLTRGISTP